MYICNVGIHLPVYRYVVLNLHSCLCENLKYGCTRKKVLTVFPLAHTSQTSLASPQKSYPKRTFPFLRAYFAKAFWL